MSMGSTGGDDSLFDRRTLLALIAIGAIGIAGMLGMRLFSDDLVPQRTAGANAYSYSAIGHRAAVETLRRSGHNVIVSRYNSAAKSGVSGILVLAEPHLSALTDSYLASLQAARTILLVLPKWRGRQDPEQPDWLATAEPQDTESVLAIMERVTGHRASGLLRGSATTRFDVTLDDRQPTLASYQLILGPEETAQIARGRGHLLARVPAGGRRIWVLSDPDILANHGLGKGDNAALLVDMMNRIDPAATALVFDETIHGFERRPSLWHALIEFPFILVSFCVLFAIGFFLWAATGRFGAPLPGPTALAQGKAGLIANTAGLLRAGGYGAHVLGRYADATVADVARRLHCPPALSAYERLEWLDRIGGARGVGEAIAALYGQAEATRNGRQAGDVAALARRLYRWKQEMLDAA